MTLPWQSFLTFRSTHQAPLPNEASKQRDAGVEQRHFAQDGVRRLRVELVDRRLVPAPPGPRVGRVGHLAQPRLRLHDSRVEVSTAPKRVDNFGEVAVAFLLQLADDERQIPGTYDIK